MTYVDDVVAMGPAKPLAEQTENAVWCDSSCFNQSRVGWNVVNRQIGATSDWVGKDKQRVGRNVIGKDPHILYGNDARFAAIGVFEPGLFLEYNQMGFSLNFVDNFVGHWDGFLCSL